MRHSGRVCRQRGETATSWRGRDGLDEVADLLLVDVARQVGLADDPDQVVPVDHRQPPHLVLGHRVQRLLDGVVGPDRHGLALAELARLGRAGVLALRDDLHHDVAVGQHALEPVVLAADRHRAHVEIGEPLRGFGDRVVLADALRAAGHDFTRLLAHAVAPFGRLPGNYPRRTDAATFGVRPLTRRARRGRGAGKPTPAWRSSESAAGATTTRRWPRPAATRAGTARPRTSRSSSAGWRARATPTARASHGSAKTSRASNAT